MQSHQPPYLSRASLRDGYYVLREEGQFVAFEQERGCRLHESRFADLAAAERHIYGLRSAQSVPSRAKA